MLWVDVTTFLPAVGAVRKTTRRPRAIFRPGRRFLPVVLAVSPSAPAYAPRYLRSDYGPEFVTCAIPRWLHDRHREALIDPGKFRQNGCRRIVQRQVARRIPHAPMVFGIA